MDKLLKPYNSQDTEDRIYASWEQGGFFNPDVCIQKGYTASDADYFSIVLPPPNVTGTLHMGHAAMLAIEDIAVRYNRMCGKRTLWLPGTDHAAIATQSKVETILYKEEGKRRHDLGREELLKRVEKFAQDSHDTIVNQVRKMGSSIDWSREAFTLDEKRNLAVRTAFKKMFDDGLIYRGYRIVNWDPKGQTTISDDEIVYKESKTTLYTFRYSKDFPIAISTTRPETKVGDTGVAVNPSDERYKHLIGKEYDITFAGVPIHVKIVADEAADPAFGTGAVGVTPAHSQIDWQIAQRHKLPIVPVINEYAKMADSTGTLAGKKVTDARIEIVEWLKKEDLLEKEEDVAHNIATAERTGATVEPLPKLQWFINVNKEFTLPYSNITGIASGSVTTLKELMRAVINNGQIKIIPDRFEKIYFQWVDNLRDWCISRQIWYGHRIPVWYKGEEIFCGMEAPTGEGWVQDEDTLDTWFSSGLWTFSTLGWPDMNSADLKNFHPTSLMETGYDIIFFWVARMVLMTTYLLGEIPFKTVYLHGLVRDAKGQKMSKSLGNLIDPLEMIKKYGADATRMSLIIGTGPGNDMKLSEDKVRGYKNFANKIWNATRFVLENVKDCDYSQKPILTEGDEKAIAEFEITLKDVTADIDNYRYYLAGEKLYHYFWHTFADVYIEQSKSRLSADKNSTDHISVQWTLLYILENCIRALHPFIPFVTEELWAMLPTHNKKMLIVESWPVVR
ncbi:MAG: valine--tRNA ligase [Candidatus Paceibacterota bacterium]|jgi:valyl-tRNA synthetase